ncbi:MAG: hypothetical protein ACK5O7_06500 [Holosporales bacterium]
MRAFLALALLVACAHQAEAVTDRTKRSGGQFQAINVYHKHCPPHLDIKQMKEALSGKFNANGKPAKFIIADAEVTSFLKGNKNTQVWAGIVDEEKGGHSGKDPTHALYYNCKYGVVDEDEKAVGTFTISVMPDPMKK